MIDIRTGKTMTRRKFGLGIAAVIASGSAPAAFFRSLIGARTATMGGGKSDYNPYQTSDNALIAMWDGIWNGGVIGEHLDETDSLVDCVSSNIITPTTYTTGQGKFVVGNDYYYIYRMDAFTQIPGLRDILMSGSITLQNTYVKEFGEYISMSCCRTDPFGGYSDVGKAYLRLDSASQWFNCGSQNARVLSQASVDGSTYSGISDGHTVRLLRNYDEIASGNYVSAGNIPENNTFAMCIRGYGTASHCKRIYKRALSGDEIRWMRDVDIERFSLA